MTQIDTFFPLPGIAGELSRPQKHRAMGAIIGAAVGDALGAPFEFMPAGAYRARFPEPCLGGAGEMVGGGAFGWAPGEFTDDTQMAMLLAEAMLERDGYDPDTVWRWFRSWATTARDIGANTRWSLSFDDWRTIPVERTNRGAGNGALMRAFPLAVALLHAPDDVVRDVVLHQASLTHQHPAAGLGAWVAVEMIRFAIMGDDPFVELDLLVADMPDAVRAQFAPILAASWDPSQPSPHNGTVWGCLAQAVWAVRTTSTFEDAVVAAVSLGDDADTVACVTGAIAGAVYGVQAIPSRWVAYVHGSVGAPGGEVIRYDAASLQAMTHRLLGLDR